MDSAIGLFVGVPVAGFRAPHAREYLETLPVPPPATLYGMLLALVGETDRRRHQGAEVAEAMLSDPPVSVVLRTAWRVKHRRLPPGSGGNRRPDYQELLTGVRLAAWVRPGQEQGPGPCLSERVAAALADPGSVRRFGGLALGESTHLVDELRALCPGDLPGARPLVADPLGDLVLPVWPNHVGSRGRLWGHYRLAGHLAGPSPPAAAWIAIRPGPV